MGHEWFKSLRYKRRQETGSKTDFMTQFYAEIDSKIQVNDKKQYEV